MDCRQRPHKVLEARQAAVSELDERQGRVYREGKQRRTMLLIVRLAFGQDDVVKRGEEKRSESIVESSPDRHAFLTIT